MESVPVYKDREVIGTIELTNIRYPFEYNIGEADMVLRTNYAETKLSKVKAVFEKNVNNGKINLISIVGRNFAVIPNQLILNMVADVSKDLNLSTLSVKYTKNGYAMRIDLLSERKEAVEVNDLVQFGVSIRNSIDGSTALGVDGFTYRLACRNGATARIPNVTFNAKHVGDVNKLLDAFREALRTALEYCHQLAELYRKATRIKVTKEIAERLVELNLPMMYYKYTPIKLKVDGKDVEIDVIREDTLWNTFNSITYIITHKSRANPIARSRMTHRLHRILYEIVEATI
jgi:hypothetical protein